ncbi:hypothetical protein [Streptomyces canus]|uniref:hypothetical protein n=1 Tax=Streptomyces canus TaxID=58343 RepID=UPI002E33AF64|nr:hypothetical protein [Streptomyces canus]
MRSLPGKNVTSLGQDFPHAVQAARATRHRTDTATGKRTRQTVYALTDLTHEQACPQFIGRLARSQWTIENRLHFIRDTAFHEAERTAYAVLLHGPAARSGRIDASQWLLLRGRTAKRL